MAAAAAAVEGRLARQEREVRGLAAEVARLKEASAWASPERPGPELRALREENEKLRYRLLHLRRSLAAERARQDFLETKTQDAPRKQEREEKTTEPRAAEGAPPEDPTFIRSRLELYEELKKESDALLRSRASTHSQTIQITLSDGKVTGGQAWKTTPYQVAVDLSRGVADSVVIARVNGELWDLDRPMEGDSTLELLTFENEDAQAVYWHSSAHILGEAMENYYGGCLCYGPPIENGFYYDMHMENRMTSAGYNKFKCRILNEKIHTPTTTVYRCGPLIDLCRGPHVRHTGKIKALKIIKAEKEIFALKPMNCPGHCLMFAHRPRSWREMPLRLADFGVLHRNELSGTLSGLTRVRRFQQDDAHLFCTMEQIDITIKDAIGRYHQCATIQLDFQLPVRFNLTYVGKDGNDKTRPVIIHRAILGSVERMMAILAENYSGKWPFWLSPRQVMVVPVSPTCEEYAQQEASQAGLMADVDLDQSCTLNKKIRNAQLAQYNFIFVVGEKEKAGDAINVRTRDNKIHGEVSVALALEKLQKLKASRTLRAEEEF
ncbi:hypothetical protein E2320_013266 [Naja naja]|nr:hypothetical protein E2320_013266 [Naja naja]